jgi:glycosyltransferase involved in cell wall biosynthesis
MVNHRISGPRKRIALIFHGLSGGGMETVMLRLAAGIVARGHSVDIVVKSRRGELADRVPTAITVHEIGAESRSTRDYGPIAGSGHGFGKIARKIKKYTLKRMSFIREELFYMPARTLLLRSDRSSWRLCRTCRLEALRPLDHLQALPGIVRYLKLQRPDAVLAAEPHYNVMSVFARRITRVSTRVVITEHVQPSAGSWRHRHLRDLLRRGYLSADAIVAVSDGVGDELSHLAGIPRKRIITVHNPVVGPHIVALAEEPVDHPWFASDAPPVVLAVGRIHPQKDFRTLIHAFSRVRARRRVRLVILGAAGHGGDAYLQELRTLAGDLGVADDVDFPGFVTNPFAFMRRAGVFVLSSVYEGLGNVLIEAMACGCPVISTNCPSGPRVILDGGRYGTLVPVGDDAAMAEAIEAALDKPIESAVIKGQANNFSVDRAVEAYLRLLTGPVRSQGKKIAPSDGEMTVKANIN